MDIQTFNATFPQFAGADHLKKFIGRNVRFSGTETSDGLIHKFGIFEVIGTQLNYLGDPCLRVKCIQFKGKPYVDNFGCVMPVSRIEFVAKPAK